MDIIESGGENPGSWGRIISINKSFFRIYRKLYEELYRNVYRGLYEINRITQGILGFIEAIIRRIIGI